MLRLTNQATEHLLQIRRQRGKGEAAMARFARRDGRLVLSFVDGPSEGDRLISGPRISAVVASDIAAALDSTVIDAKRRGGRTYLVMRRANADGSVEAETRQAPGAATA